MRGRMKVTRMLMSPSSGLPTLSVGPFAHRNISLWLRFLCPWFPWLPLWAAEVCLGARKEVSLGSVSLHSASLACPSNGARELAWEEECRLVLPCEGHYFSCPCHPQLPSGNPEEVPLPCVCFGGLEACLHHLAAAICGRNWRSQDCP